MAIIKCKMCGGDLEIVEGMTVAECEYCGSKQTIPTVDNEKKLTLFGRANRLRFACEFDKAAGVYEAIVADFPEEAEAYWGLVLCKYGIEYVDDPATGRKIPTCHRSSFESVMDDSNLEQALENADVAARKLYREEAKQIEELRKGIIEVSGKEEAYDIFICYKETDENGDRTLDSVLAQDVYDTLISKGYRVFFSRITLEDKLGQEYEPYIFAALNSAKIMLAFGTDYEYFNAVWVKNEWSRYLQLMTQDKSKHLIPCYKGIDAYDMPKEFAKLQAQDLSKVGAVQDLLRGIEKLIPREEKKTESVMQQVVTSSGPNTQAMIDRGNLALEDGEWKKADEFFDRVLDMNGHCAEAYLGKLMADMRMHSFNELAKHTATFDNNINYKRAYQFGDSTIRRILTDAISQIKNRNEECRLSKLFIEATELMNNAQTKEQFLVAAQKFGGITEYQNAKDLQKECVEKAKLIGKQEKEKSKQALATVQAFLENAEYREKQREIHLLQAELRSIQKDLKALGSSAYNLDKTAYPQLIRSQKEKIEELLTSQEEKRTHIRRIEEEIRLLNFLQGKKKKELNAKIEAITSEISENLNSINHMQREVALWEKLEKHMEMLSCCDVKTPSPDVLVTIKEYSAAMEWLTQHKHHDGVQEFLNTGKSVAFLRQSSSILGGNAHTVALKSDGTVVATGFNNDGCCNVSEWRDVVAISTAWDHTVGLKSDGTVVATGENDCGECNVSEWRNIVSISTGSEHTVGLKYDGTVVAVGNNEYSQCNVSKWTDIVAIYAEDVHTVGLKSDGTVVATGENKNGQCDVSKWNNIVAISVGQSHTLGLKFDGTVIATGDNGNGACNVSAWHDIAAISASMDHSIGLKSDGTVAATGFNMQGQCNVSRWRNIVAISAGPFHTVGLKSDGTVVAVGCNDDGRCDVDNWKDIVAISTGHYHTLGLKSDGSVVAVGGNENGECDVSGWIGIKIPNT